MFRRSEYQFGRYDLSLLTEMVGIAKKVSISLVNIGFILPTQQTLPCSKSPIETIEKVVIC